MYQEGEKCGYPSTIGCLFPRICESGKFKTHYAFYTIAGILGEPTKEVGIIYKVFSEQIIRGVALYYQSLNKYMQKGFIYYFESSKDWKQVDIPIDIKFRITDGMTLTDTTNIGGDKDDIVVPYNFRVNNLFFLEPEPRFTTLGVSLNDEQAQKFASECRSLKIAYNNIKTMINGTFELRPESGFGYTRGELVNKVENNFKKICVAYSKVIADEKRLIAKYKGKQSGMMRIACSSEHEDVFNGIITKEKITGRIGDMNVKLWIINTDQKVGYVEYKCEGTLGRNTTIEKDITVSFIEGVYPEFLPYDIFDPFAIKGCLNPLDLSTYFLEELKCQYDKEKDHYTYLIRMNCQPLPEVNPPVFVMRDESLRVRASIPRRQTYKDVDYKKTVLAI